MFTDILQLFDRQEAREKPEDELQNKSLNSTKLKKKFWK